MTSGGLDPKSTELVLRRAVEIGEYQPVTGEVELTPAAVAEIAREVGLHPMAVATALAEHQAGVSSETRLIDRILGPGVVWASRAAVSGHDVTRQHSVAWLTTEHGLKTRVRDDGVVVAKKRRDVVGKVRGGVRRARGRGGLGKFRQVHVAAVDVADQPAAVCLVADIGNKRNEAVAAGAAVGAGGAVFVGVVAVFAGPATLVALPFVAGIGLATSRVAHQATVRRAEDDVEETVDNIARGNTPRRWR